jgi:hypothetical protein
MYIQLYPAGNSASSETVNAVVPYPHWKFPSYAHLAVSFLPMIIDG